MSFPDFDLNLYKPFIEVYDCKNITRAAEKLVVTASAVGMRIKELERQLGCKLFTPHRRGVYPTKEADELYAIVRPALNSIFGARDSIQEFTVDTVGSLKLGCQASVALYHLADFMSDFISKYPKIKLEVHHETKPELGQMLMRRDLDVVISTLPFSNQGANFTVEKLTDIKKAFFASREFLKKNSLPNYLTVEQISNIPLLLPSRHRDDTKSILRALGSSYDSSSDSFIEVGGSNEFINAMIKRHVGIGYINVTPDCCIVENDDIEEVKLKDVKLPSFNLSAISNKIEQSKLVKAFLIQLKQYFKNNSKT